MQHCDCILFDNEDACGFVFRYFLVGATPTNAIPTNILRRPLLNLQFPFEAASLRGRAVGANDIRNNTWGLLPAVTR